MSIAAVPAYLGQDFKQASTGLRFGMYLKLWGVNECTHQALWSTHDIVYRVRGRDQEERELREENKVSAINAACALSQSEKAAMAAISARQKSLAAALPHCFTLPARSTAPFVTGMGNEHPLENGFSFLWPYGLPYLPGSGVKGVLRQAARELISGDWGDSEWTDKTVSEITIDKKTVPLTALDLLFGLETEDRQTEHFRGVLSFWDVIPDIKGDRLMVEIMTPHQTHYYRDGRQPHDSGLPTPIPFLTVPPGSGFTFHVQCDHARLARLAPELTKDEHWKKLLKSAFDHAFDWLGFGAKTSVGYGAMRPDGSGSA